MDDLLTLSARELAEKGIEESHEHAEEESPGWTERAIEQFREYARTHEWFLTEDVREAATNAGFEEAPDKGRMGQGRQARGEAGHLPRSRSPIGQEPRQPRQEDGALAERAEEHLRAGDRSASR
jgi:hypothetical protein